MGKLRKQTVQLNWLGLPAGYGVWDASPFARKSVNNDRPQWLSICVRWRPFGDHLVSFHWRTVNREATHAITLRNAGLLSIVSEEIQKLYDLNSEKWLARPNSGAKSNPWDFIYEDYLAPFSDCWGGDASQLCPIHGYSDCKGGEQ